jgi:tetratricopeptide (TPR) repeat protein
MRLLTSTFLCLLAILQASPGQAAQAGKGSVQAPVRGLAELREAIEHDNQAHPVASVGWARQALGLLAQGQDPAAELWFLRALVHDLNTLGDFAAAASFLEKGQALAARTGANRDRLLLQVEAVALLTNTERLDEARRSLDPVLLELEAYGGAHPGDAEMRGALGRSFRLLGSMHQIHSRFQEAIQANQKAQKVFEEIHDLRGQARVLANMGLVYIALDRLEDAAASYQQAITLAKRLPDRALEANLHLELANVYAHQNRPDSELAALALASALAARIQDSYLELLAAANLSDAHLRAKDYKAALQCAESSLSNPAIANHPSFVAGCQVNQGIALSHLGRGPEGIRAIQKGLEYYRASQSRNEAAEVTGNLAEEYARAGDFRRAYETGLEFKKLSDELKRTEDLKRIADASASFEFDKKQTQLETLQREHQNQARFKWLWIALGTLGFSLAGVLVAGRRKLLSVNDGLTEVNQANRALIEQFHRAAAEVRNLQGLIPICAECKKIRDDQGAWNQLELYIQNHSEATFSHGLCPDCARDFLTELPGQLPPTPLQVARRSPVAEAPKDFRGGTP